MNRRLSWRLAPAALLALLAGCSTYTATLHATVGDDLNPSLTGTPGVLRVYAFFLKKTDAFLADGRQFADFVTDELRDDARPPAFLAEHVAAVRTLFLQPAPQGEPVEVEFEVEEVANEAASVGLIAAWQSHDDRDKGEVWRVVVPVRGGVARFRVAGKRIEALEAAPPPPSDDQQSSSPKEAQRGTRRSR